MTAAQPWNSEIQPQPLWSRVLIAIMWPERPETKRWEEAESGREVRTGESKSMTARVDLTSFRQGNFQLNSDISQCYDDDGDNVSSRLFTNKQRRSLLVIAYFIVQLHKLHKVHNYDTFKAQHCFIFSSSCTLDVHNLLISTAIRLSGRWWPFHFCEQETESPKFVLFPPGVAVKRDQTGSPSQYPKPSLSAWMGATPSSPKTQSEAASGPKTNRNVNKGGSSGEQEIDRQRPDQTDLLCRPGPEVAGKFLITLIHCAPNQTGLSQPPGFYLTLCFFIDFSPLSLSSRLDTSTEECGCSACEWRTFMKIAAILRAYCLLSFLGVHMTSRVCQDGLRAENEEGDDTGRPGSKGGRESAGSRGVDRTLNMLRKLQKGENWAAGKQLSGLQEARKTFP